MLTEKQFKVLMILFDDKGHAGWDLAKTLGMEESNLNPLLKRLEKKKFIFQGPPRKSNRHKDSEKVKKREGDYKEIPYFLNKDLNILKNIIREMVVTNKTYDTGFPFKIIKTSDYIKSMREIYNEDLNKCLVNSSRELPKALAEEVEHDINKLIVIPRPRKLAGAPPFKDKRVSRKVLKEIELWYESYLDKMQYPEPSDSIRD